MAAVYSKIGKLTNGRDAFAAAEYAVWWTLFKRLVWLKYRVNLEVIQALGHGKFSGGTHGAPGASLDLRTWRFTLRVTLGIVLLAREAGAQATWYRKRSQGFDPHIHLVLAIMRWSPAFYQEVACRVHRRNGLGRGGMSRADDGPRPSQWRTYKQGILWMQGQIHILEGGRPGLPSSGADGPTVRKPTSTSTPTLTPKGGLSMSDVNTIMAELKLVRAELKSARAENAGMRTRLIYLEAQNKSIAQMVADAPLKVWQFPVFRTIKGKRVGVAIIQDLATLGTQVSAMAVRK